jgi:hypothetical protein
MKLSVFLLASAGIGLLAGCGDDSIGPGGARDAAVPAGNPDAGAPAGGAGGSSGGSGGAGGTGGNAAGGMGGGTPMGGTGGAPPGTPTPPMPAISFGVPAHASGTEGGNGAGNANDGEFNRWWTAAVPAWIAYDLSSRPAEQRQDVLVAWYGPRTQDHINQPPGTGKSLPADYTVEINTAPGGAVPTSGWTVVATVTGNLKNSKQHLVPLKGANWVRLNITRGTDPSVSLDLDVHSAPSGPSDSWLFMGDSITASGLNRAFSDLQRQVNTLKPAYYPAVINAAIGGTNTQTALAALERTLDGFPGKFVVLAYGTNDHPREFKMESLVQMVIAAGKVPVIPHQPWSTARLDEGPMNNAIIDALYEKYPQIVRGPDLWAAFMNRTDLVPQGDVHPNQAGNMELRKQWAAAMAKIYQ